MALPEELPIQTETANALVALSLHAIEVARKAAAKAGDALASGSPELFQELDRLEEELDHIDREMDEGVALAVTRLSVEQARELLACLKFTIDLERIGDLIASFAGRARALGFRLEPEDMHDLVKMAAVLERMLEEAHRAFSTRDLNRAIWLLRADAEIDRLRNLVFSRHVDSRESASGPEGVHVVFMAQALERAGDHAKNLAEEIIHLVGGHSVRHILRARGPRSQEQMFLEWLRQRNAPAGQTGSEPA